MATENFGLKIGLEGEKEFNYCKSNRYLIGFQSEH